MTLPQAQAQSPDWTKPGQPFRFVLFGRGVTGSAVDIATDPASAGELWSVERVTVRDVNNGATRAELLAGRYGAERYVGATGALTVGVPLSFTDGFYLSDSERLIIRFIGSTTGDVLEVTLEGEVRYQPPPPLVKVEVSG